MVAVASQEELYTSIYMLYNFIIFEFILTFLFPLPNIPLFHVLQYSDCSYPYCLDAAVIANTSTHIKFSCKDGHRNFDFISLHSPVRELLESGLRSEQFVMKCTCVQL
jgi:hypothetical protein